ncbi:MAG: sulfotransferase domain-containing protein [Bacteroidetes bacterium]|nr:sulfotransferase domain-containing protein [Bacteroidota bacterium]
MNKNIVWLVSYPKSGNTWFRMFLANYMKNTQHPVSLDEIESTPISSDPICFEELTGLNPFELTPDEVDLFRPEVYQVISQETENTGKINYKKTHDAYTLNNNGVPLFPEGISRCAIYFIRNPLDVCVSYAKHSAVKMEKMVYLLLNDDSHLAGNKTGQLRQKVLSWKNHIKSWHEQTLIPIHIVRYEDMQQNTIKTFGSIVNFLELEFNEARLERAIVNSDFKLLQKMEKEKGFKEKPQISKNFFRKGKIGNYREYLSEEQIQRIVEYNYDTMKEFEYIDEQGKLTV